MKDSRVSAFFWAAGLTGAGLILLLFNFGLLARYEPMAQYIVAAIFSVAGLGFFGSYFAERSMWWRVIPGWTLLSVACMVILSTVSRADPLLIPAILFLGLALAFGNIYVIDRRDNWWSIIPGGFMLVLSLVIGLYTFVENLEALFALLLVGMGVVFLLLALLGPAHIQWWPLIPGLVLVLFGLFILSGGADSDSRLLNWWPIVLIMIGLGIGWRAVAFTPKRDKLSVNMAPGTSSTRDQSVALSSKSVSQESGVLGEYSEPAPGASVEVLSGADDQ